MPVKKPNPSQKKCKSSLPCLPVRTQLRVGKCYSYRDGYWECLGEEGEGNPDLLEKCQKEYFYEIPC